MGKTTKRAARQAMERRQAGAATPKTDTGPPKVQTRIAGDLQGDAAAAQLAAAALGNTPIITEVKAAEDQTEAEMRKADLVKLHTMAQVSGLKPVRDEITLVLTPLRRSGSYAAAAHFDESATGEQCYEALDAAKLAIDKALGEHPGGYGLADISVGHRAQISLVTQGSNRNRRNGGIKVRIERAFQKHVTKVLDGIHFAVAPAHGVEFTHEAVFDAKYYAGSVVEQVKLQSGLTAHVFVQPNEGTVSYRMECTSAAQVATIEKRGFLAEFGTHGKLIMREIDRRNQLGLFFMYGLPVSGKVAEIDFLPEVASAMAISSDLVTCRPATNVIRNSGLITAISFPETVQAFDTACRFIDSSPIGWVNPRTGTPFEIHFAPSPLEMQKRLKIKFVREESLDELEDEGVKGIELNPRVTTGARAAMGHSLSARGSLLMPVAAWAARRELWEETAEEARRWIRRRAEGEREDRQEADGVTPRARAHAAARVGVEGGAEAATLILATHGVFLGMGSSVVLPTPLPYHYLTMSWDVSRRQWIDWDEATSAGLWREGGQIGATVEAADAGDERETRGRHRAGQRPADGGLLGPGRERGLERLLSWLFVRRGRRRK